MVQALAGLILDGRPGITTPAELVVFSAGTVVTLAGFLAIVWRIARPHVAHYIESVVAPVRRDLAEVREEVKPNSGNSLKDNAVQAASAASEVSRQLDQVAHAVNHVSHNLDQHVHDSREYLAEARGMFKAHGIELPPTPPHKEDDSR